MDFKSIEQLIKAVSDSNLTSFEVEQEGKNKKKKKLKLLQFQKKIPFCYV